MLIVEDDSDARESLAELIRQEGYAVTSERSAEAALGQIDAGLRPKILVVDHGLPGMSGAALLGRCQHDPRLASVRAALITGFDAGPPVIEHGLSGVSVLRKPVEVPTLLSFLSDGGPG